MTSALHDLLDWNAVLPQRENYGVRFFPMEVSFILEALGGSEQIRIDNGGADRRAEVTHGFAHRVDEGAACILHEVPTIDDLCRLRQSLPDGLSISAATIAGDDAD